MKFWLRIKLLFQSITFFKLTVTRKSTKNVHNNRGLLKRNDNVGWVSLHGGWAKSDESAAGLKGIGTPLRISGINVIFSLQKMSKTILVNVTPRLVN